MNLDTAKSIYLNPEGHSIEELELCLLVLNEAAQPVQVSPLQFLALSDAIQRLHPSRSTLTI